MVSRVCNQRLCCHWRPRPSCSTETTLHPLSTLIPTRTIRFQRQPLLNVTLPLPAILVLVALFRALMVPTAIVDPIEAHLLTVVALLHPGVLLRPQLYVLLLHFYNKKKFFMLIISRRRPILPTYLAFLGWVFVLKNVILMRNLVVLVGLIRLPLFTTKGSVWLPLFAPCLSNLSQQSDRSRGFGFIKMATVEDATRCIQELNGIVCLRIFKSQSTT